MGDSTDLSIIGTAIKWLNQALEPALHPHSGGDVLSDWKFWFGLVGVLLYWALWYYLQCVATGQMECCGGEGEGVNETFKWWKDTIKFVYYLSQNLLLLAILNAPALFSMVLFSLVTFEMLNYLFVCYRTIDTTRIVPAIQVQNVYTNLTDSLSRAATLFVAQLIFVILYLDAVIVSMKPLKENNFAGINYAFWLLAMIACQYATMILATQSSQVGAFWNFNAWAIIFSQVNLALDVDQLGETGRSLQNAARFCMDVIINGFARLAIILSVPLWMMTQESGLDLVMNCLAIAFITALDDRDPLTLTWTDEDFNLEVVAPAPANNAVGALAPTCLKPVPENYALASANYALAPPQAALLPSQAIA